MFGGGLDVYVEIGQMPVNATAFVNCNIVSRFSKHGSALINNLSHRILAPIGMSQAPQIWCDRGAAVMYQ